MTERNYYGLLRRDVRFEEGLNTCINCGTCTAICPAAEFYPYDPRIIMDAVQSRREAVLEGLLRSDEIWYCGECMSCRTRCPRNNTPGLVIMALRSLSQDLGFFMESEKGRQQFIIMRTIGDWILSYGYCLYLEGVGTVLHPEQGPVWEWRQNHWNKVSERLGGNYKGNGPGILRTIPEEALAELRKIFDVTGGTERLRKIEEFSARKAAELNLELAEGIESDYFFRIYRSNTGTHHRE